MDTLDAFGRTFLMIVHARAHVWGDTENPSKPVQCVLEQI